jgi:hypothetical protein
VANVKTPAEVKIENSDDSESVQSEETEPDVPGSKILNFFGSYITLSKTDRIKASETDMVTELQAKIDKLQGERDFRDNDYKLMSD